jgi:predicted phosphodiesterase
VRFGVISDIHGNFRALESVWRVLNERGLADGRTVLNAGDNVGYGDAPVDCVQFLRARPQILGVQGNYDKHVARFTEKKDELHRKWGKSRPDKYAAIRRDSEALSADDQQWLRDLPGERTLTLEGEVIFLTHYAPGSKEGLGTWTPDNRLEELARATEARVVVCGHTHTAFGIVWRLTPF